MGFCSFTTQAQSIQLGPYSPVDTSAFLKQLATIEQKAILPEQSKYTDHYRKAYRERTEHLATLLADDELIFNPVISAYLGEILQEIISANGFADRPLVLVSRAPVINATSLGDDLFIVYTGLLYALKTEDEIAFVLAHELAHDHLEHSRQSIHELALAQYDEKGRKITERDRRKQRRKTSRVDYLLSLREAAYLQRQHSRNNELQADSLALVYLHKTKYDPAKASLALAELNQDTLLDFSAAAITQLLNTEDYPFQLRWTKPKASLFGGSFGGSANEHPKEETDFWVKDSLRTHPDIDLRITAISVASRDTVLTATTRPIGSRFKQWVIHEALANYQRKGLPVHVLCLALKQMERSGDTALARRAIIAALFDVTRSIDDYTFDEIVPPPLFFEHEGGQHLVRMLHRMRRDELQDLTLAFLADSRRFFPKDQKLIEQEKAITLHFKQ